MKLRVNGKEHSVEVSGNNSLLSTLREQLDLTGSKYGCGEGVCGTCTVLVNGLPVRSCITPAGSVQNKEITTIEGLAENDKLHKVQESFLETDPFQCAYCAPGMIMSAASLLKKNPNPSRQEIMDAMEGNVCRCGTYTEIIEAIMNSTKN